MRRFSKVARAVATKKPAVNPTNVTLRFFNPDSEFKVNKYSNRSIFDRYEYEEHYEAEKSGTLFELVKRELSSSESEDKNHVSKGLHWLTFSINNRDDFNTVVTTAAKVATALRLEGHQESFTKKPTVRVAVTGAAGNIAYSLIPRIASGEMLGADQPVFLQLIDLPNAMDKVNGVVMELQDCAFPLLRGVSVTSDINVGLNNVDYALFVGSKPRTKGMERADLLKDNGAIFVETGKALNKHAKKSCLSVVVGNPANTNCLVLASNAPDIPKNQFTALTRLDQDRALAQVAKRTGVNVSEINNLNIWGNHSPTMFPDVSNATINGKPAASVINDDKWVGGEFLTTVQQRGGAIIQARGASSAASAADATIKHMRDWVQGSDEPVSMAIATDGTYDVPEGLYSSFPVKCQGAGKYEIVKNLKIDNASKTKINASIKELQQEKKAVQRLLK
mmetsp:Transcript_8323/g.12329  ORF Transcript_8323/g.12329 Transcript_8323/m.12329 type:complete len:449 (-) Transcript_8323:71-1417(-)